MEGRQSQAVFESLNLNPQLFINETLNTVDDLVDDAFHFFRQSASTLLKNDAASSLQSLDQGIDCIHNKIRSDLDVRLGIWEKYCLHHCFTVPKGFSLPKTGSPDENQICQDMLCDPDLDVQLYSLRDKLTMIQRESADLKHELQELERQSTSSDRCASLANEVFQQYEQNGFHDMFLEMMRTSADLRTRMDKVRNNRMENTEHTRAKRICKPDGDMLLANGGKGLFTANLEDLQEFVSDLKKM